MNQDQFANVLIKAMPYYIPYPTESGRSSFMCHAIEHHSNCSKWEKKRAVSKIRKVLDSKLALELYLKDNKFIGENITMAATEYKKKALTFWAIQIALGKKYPSPTIEKLSSYLTHDNPVGWETAQQILNRYVK